MAVGMSYHSYLVRKKLFRIYFEREELNLNSKILKIFVGASIAVFSLGQISRIELPSGGAVYGFEALMVFVILLYLIDLIRSKRSLILFSYSTYLILWWFILLLSLGHSLSFYSATPITTPLMYWLRLGVYIFFLISMTDMVRIKLWRFNQKNLLIYAGFVFVLMGYIQYVFFPDTRFLLWYGWDDHYYRMIGSLFDPGYLGLIFVLLLILLEEKLKSFSIGLYILTFLAMGLTYARSAFVVYGLVMIFMAWRKRSIKFAFIRLFALSALVILLMTFVPAKGEGVNLKRTYSIRSRATSALTAYDIFSEKPLFGIGFNRYPEYAESNTVSFVPFHPSAPDNSYAFILSTSGILGFISFVALGIAIARFYWQDLSVIASILAIALHSLTNNSFFYVFCMFWLVILLSQREKGAEV
jgi:O-antigen ligase